MPKTSISDSERTLVDTAHRNNVPTGNWAAATDAVKNGLEEVRAIPANKENDKNLATARKASNGTEFINAIYFCLENRFSY